MRVERVCSRAVDWVRVIVVGVFRKGLGHSDRRIFVRYLIATGGDRSGGGGRSVEALVVERIRYCGGGGGGLIRVGIGLILGRAETLHGGSGRL